MADRALTFPCLGLDGPAHDRIPFNRPVWTGCEGQVIDEVFASRWTAGNGAQCARCEELLRELTGSARVLLTGSCTAALEMAALLLEVGPGDEVIMPSFTFVSTANAFVLRGATPIFVDIRPSDLTLDPAATAAAITERTAAIVPVHYGGGAADMNLLVELARRANVPLIEDAAQSICATYEGRPLGTFGSLGALSFHETKNIGCGEGGALLVNDPSLIHRAEILQEKGTDRMRFQRGEVRSYRWMDVGSSFLLSDLAAALLAGVLVRAEEITWHRRQIWLAYHEAFADLERRGLVKRPSVATAVGHNGHIYYLLAPDEARRNQIIDSLEADHVTAQFHYVPLHLSPAGRRFGRPHGSLHLTEDISRRLVRMPLWVGLSRHDVDRVVRGVERTLTRRNGPSRSQKIGAVAASGQGAHEPTSDERPRE